MIDVLVISWVKKVIKEESVGGDVQIEQIRVNGKMSLFGSDEIGMVQGVMFMEMGRVEGDGFRFQKFMSVVEWVESE